MEIKTMEMSESVLVELFMGFSTLLIAFLGARMYLKPPTYKNELFGYRTKRAFENEASWFFAQKFSGKWLFITMIFLSIMRVWFCFLGILNDNLDILYIALLVFLPIMIVVVTERKLKQYKRI